MLFGVSSLFVILRSFSVIGPENSLTASPEPLLCRRKNARLPLFRFGFIRLCFDRDKGVCDSTHRRKTRETRSSRYSFRRHTMFGSMP